MKLYSIKRNQFLPITLEQAWEFFSSPHNLSRITPEQMEFKIISISGDSMYAGQIIQYKINVFPFITTRWVTEITHVQKPYYFVDEQRFGPYAFWHHQHHFREVAGGVETTDVVSYGIPLGPLGQLANRIYVKRKLQQVFDHRAKTLESLFQKDKNIFLSKLA